MLDTLDDMIWQLGTTTGPAIREEILKAYARSSPSYSVPRRMPGASGELETLQERIFSIPEERGKAQAIRDPKKVDQMTVGELTERLALIHTYYRIQDVKGALLLPEERTLRDLDITALALLILKKSDSLKRDSR